MNTVTPEQLAAAHKADLASWMELHEHTESLKDEKYHRLWRAWREANEHSHQLQARFDAQKLLYEQPQPNQTPCTSAKYEKATS